MTLSATSISPMLEPTHWSPNPSQRRALAAARAAVLLERRELVSAGRDRNHAGGHRPVRPVQRVDRDAHEHPDRKVRPDEQWHGAHTAAAISKSHDCRGCTPASSHLPHLGRRNLPRGISGGGMPPVTMHTILPLQSDQDDTQATHRPEVAGLPLTAASHLPFMARP
jgi:hypothetical protein